MSDKFHERKDLEDLDAQLIYKKNQDEIDFTPIELSQSGLAILVPEEISQGEILVFKIKKDVVEFSVSWCTESENVPGYYRVGLACVDEGLHFDLLIEQHLLS